MRSGAIAVTVASVLLASGAPAGAAVTPSEGQTIPAGTEVTGPCDSKLESSFPFPGGSPEDGDTMVFTATWTEVEYQQPDGSYRDVATIQTDPEPERNCAPVEVTRAGKYQLHSYYSYKRERYCCGGWATEEEYINEKLAKFTVGSGCFAKEAACRKKADDAFENATELAGCGRRRYKPGSRDITRGASAQKVQGAMMEGASYSLGCFVLHGYTWYERAKQCEEEGKECERRARRAANCLRGSSPATPFAIAPPPPAPAPSAGAAAEGPTGSAQRIYEILDAHDIRVGNAQNAVADAFASLPTRPSVAAGQAALKRALDALRAEIRLLRAEIAVAQTPDAAGRTAKTYVLRVLDGATTAARSSRTTMTGRTRGVRAKRRGKSRARGVRRTLSRVVADRKRALTALGLSG